MLLEALHFVVPHLLSIVGFVMALVLLASGGRSRRPTGSTVAWLLAFLLVPYLGVPLFLLIGRRKLLRSAAKVKLSGPVALPTTSADEAPLVRMLCSSGARPPSSDNRVELLETGESAFAAFVAVIDGATHAIDVSTLIFADDEVGAEIARRLAERAREGVRVRVLVDALFKFRSSRKMIASLRSAGVSVAWFMPIWSVSLRRSANLRLHRKVVIADDAVAIVGGMNIAREYMGPSPLEGRWRDLSLRVHGKAVRDIATIFAADWQFATAEPVAVPAALPSHVSVPSFGAGARGDSVASDASDGPARALVRRAAAGILPPVTGVPIQVVGSGPDVESDLVYDAVLSSVFEARRRLWIATPYFVPDETLQRALALATRRGVDVRVLVPKRSNHRTADLAGAPYLRDLARFGARIACFEPGMMHAKVLLVDDGLAVLGSANMDMRSFFLDYEIALYMASPVVVAQISAWFETAFASCVSLEPADGPRALLESIARLLAPLE